MLEINVNVKVEGLDGLAEAIKALAGKMSAMPTLAPTVVEPGSEQAVAEPEPKKAKAAKKAKPEEKQETAPTDAETPEVKPEEKEKPKPKAEPKPDTKEAKNNAAMLYKLSEAGASLLESGKMNDLINLLHTFHVEAVTMLKPDQYDDFARGLRALGAMI